MRATLVLYNQLIGSQGFDYANIGINVSIVPISGNYSQNDVMFSSIAIPQIGNHNPINVMFGSVFGSQQPQLGLSQALIIGLQPSGQGVFAFINVLTLIVVGDPN